jgi:hypothetical protein
MINVVLTAPVPAEVSQWAMAMVNHLFSNDDASLPVAQLKRVNKQPFTINVVQYATMM